MEINKANILKCATDIGLVEDVDDDGVYFTLGEDQPPVDQLVELVQVFALLTSEGVCYSLITKPTVIKIAVDIGLVDWVSSDGDNFSFSEEHQISKLLIELVQLCMCEKDTEVKK